MSEIFFAFVGFMAAVAIAGCDEFDLEPRTPATALEIKDSLGLAQMTYFGDDTFNGNPQGLLGQIVVIRGQGGMCPRNANDKAEAKFSIEPLRGFKIDEKSILGSPVKREEQIITHDTAASVAFLSYLSSSLDAKSVYTLMVFDQASARVDDKDSTWREAFKSWMNDHAELLQQPDLCKVSVIMGFVQKNVVRRKFNEMSASAKGGAYGVNVNGKYHTSTEGYSVDVRYGLSLGMMWERSVTRPGGHSSPTPPREAPRPPTPAELELLSSITTIHHEQR